MWLNNDCLNPYRDTQQASPISHCSHCQSGIYFEEECYIIRGEVICSDCLEDVEKEKKSSMTGYALENYLHGIYGGLDDID